MLVLADFGVANWRREVPAGGGPWADGRWLWGGGEPPLADSPLESVLRQARDAP